MLILHCKTGTGKTLITQALLIALHIRYTEAKKAFLFCNATMYQRDIALHTKI